MISMGDEYLQTRVMTASPYRLHLMVIDEILKHSRRTHEALQSEDFETSHTESVRAREYLAEVLAGIRDDVSQELSSNVKDYFLHIQKSLHEADMKQDVTAAAKAVELIEGYRETWVKLQDTLPESA